MSDFHNTYEWQKARDVIRKRYNNQCADPFGIHINKGMITNNIVFASVIHHIVPVDVDITKATNVNNLVPLCPKCHELAHNLLRTPQGRIEYRKAFKLSMDTNICKRDETAKKQAFFTNDKCYRMDNKVFCVRCGKLRDHPCSICYLAKPDRLMS